MTAKPVPFFRHAAITLIFLIPSLALGIIMLGGGRQWSYVALVLMFITGYTRGLFDNV